MRRRQAQSRPPSATGLSTSAGTPASGPCTTSTRKSTETLHACGAQPTRGRSGPWEGQCRAFAWTWHRRRATDIPPGGGHTNHDRRCRLPSSNRPTRAHGDSTSAVVRPRQRSRYPHQTRRRPAARRQPTVAGGHDGCGASPAGGWSRINLCRRSAAPGSRHPSNRKSTRCPSATDHRQEKMTVAWSDRPTRTHGCAATSTCPGLTHNGASPGRWLAAMTDAARRFAMNQKKTPIRRPGLLLAGECIATDRRVVSTMTAGH
ncbi:hypothetical protein KBTX_02838 [wastewater metagenome]|uniref:Uncharacterized protein n=2 Tax=unclassified sequences TaxID=12908 RepID=A0A5B8RF70_9ZZZZ|nr:hypothetical protein KBTEX_02838 [uncultured organism]